MTGGHRRQRRRTNTHRQPAAIDDTALNSLPGWLASEQAATNTDTPCADQAAAERRADAIADDYEEQTGRRWPWRPSLIPLAFSAMGPAVGGAFTAAGTIAAIIGALALTNGTEGPHAHAMTPPSSVAVAPATMTRTAYVPAAAPHPSASPPSTQPPVARPSAVSTPQAAATGPGSKAAPAATAPAQAPPPAAATSPAAPAPAPSPTPDVHLQAGGPGGLDVGAGGQTGVEVGLGGLGVTVCLPVLLTCQAPGG